MSEREYVKLNSSIQTASNGGKPIYDEEGNIEATIEMRLPDNIFANNSQSPRKIDGVSMLTTKFRLSMENTPIAQIPLDMEKTKENSIVSTCQLDVYPYCYLDDNQLAPDPDALGTTIAFPSYKNHEITYSLCIWEFPEGEEPAPMQIDDPTFTIPMNCGEAVYPKSHIWDFIMQTGAVSDAEHLMNLCIQSNHEKYMIEGDQLLIKNIGTLEQMLQDALENAVTFASTSFSGNIVIDVVPEGEYPSDLSPAPNPDLKVELQGHTYVFWKYRNDISSSQIENNLKFAFKPRVQIGEQSLTISYDSAAFDNIIPIIWNTPYVETYDRPEQMTLDTLMNSVWNQPPPKRQYKYGVKFSDDKTFEYTWLRGLKCAAINIICNKAMRETFSFLPWIPVDGQNFPDFSVVPETYTSEYLETKTRTFDRENGRALNSALREVAQEQISGYRIVNEGKTVSTFEHDTHYTSPNLTPEQRSDNMHYLFYEYQEDDETVGKYNIRIWVGDATTSFTNTTLARNSILGNISYSTQTTTIPDDDSLYPANTSQTQTLNIPSTDPVPTNKTETGNTTAYTKSRQDGETYEVSDGAVYASGFADGAVSGLTWVFEKVEGELNTTFRNWLNSHPENWYLLFKPPWVGIIRLVRTETISENVERRTFVELYTLTSQNQIVYTMPQFNLTAQNLNDLVFTTVTAANYESYIQCTFPYTDTTTYTLIGEEGSGNELIPKTLPNFTLDDDKKFYMLDGTTAEVSIGSPELIPTSEGSEYKYKVFTRVEEHHEHKQKFTNIYSLPQTSDPIAIVDSGGTVEDMATFNMQGWRIGPDFYDTPDVVNNIVIFVRFNYPNRHIREVMPIYQYLSMGFDGPARQALQANHLYNYDEAQELSVINRDATIHNAKKSYGYGEPIDEPFITQSTTYSNEDLTPGTETSSTPHVENDTNSSSTRPDHVGLVCILSDNGTSLGNSLLATELYSHEYSQEQVTVYCASVDDSLYTPDYTRTFDEPDEQDSSWDRTVTIYAYKLKTDTSFTSYNIMTTYNNADISTRTCNGLFCYPEGHGYTDYTQFARVYNDEVVTVHHDRWTDTTVITTAEPQAQGVGNVRLSFTWNNLPMVVMSPIASIVLTLNGMQLNQEIQPINSTEETAAASSLTTVVPIIENYYSLAQTLRDLHDELVIVKDSYDDQSKYTVAVTAGQERSFTMSAKYITKDGRIHQIFIPPNGVFSVQLTFGISYYLA